MDVIVLRFTPVRALRGLLVSRSTCILPAVHIAFTARSDGLLHDRWRCARASFLRWFDLSFCCWSLIIFLCVSTFRKFDRTFFKVIVLFRFISSSGIVCEISRLPLCTDAVLLFSMAVRIEKDCVYLKWELKRVVFLRVRSEKGCVSSSKDWKDLCFCELGLKRVLFLCLRDDWKEFCFCDWGMIEKDSVSVPEGGWKGLCFIKYWKGLCFC